MNQAELWSRNFIILCVANLFMAIAFYFLISTLPVYLVEVLKEDKANAGLIISFYTLAAVIIRPFTGAAIDKYGRKWIYISALFAFALMFGLYAVASTLVLLLLLRFAHGLSWGITSTSGSTIAADILPQKKLGEGLGIFGLSMTMGMAVGPYIGMIILGDNRFLDVFYAGMALALTGFALAFFIRYPKIRSHEIKINFSSLFFPPSFPLSLTLLITMISYGSLLTFISVFAREQGLASPGWFFLLFAIGLAIARIAGGRFFDRYGPSAALYPSYFFLIVGFPILAMSNGNFIFLLAAVILGFGFGLIFPVFQAMVNKLANFTNRGAANSTLFTALDIGIGLGSVLLGQLADITSLKTAYIIIAIAPLAGFVLFRFYSFQHYLKKLSDK